MKASSDVRAGGHVADLLPGFVNGTLPRPEREQVMRHLPACQACTTNLKAWQAIREATREAADHAPATPEGVLDRLWTTLDAIERAAPEARATSRKRFRPVSHDSTTRQQQPPMEDVMTTLALPHEPVAQPLGVPRLLPERRALRSPRRLIPALVAVAAMLLLTVAGLLPARPDLPRLGGLLLTQRAVPPDVPMFRGDPARTGVMPGPAPADKPDILWQAATSGQIRTTPALFSGVLYVASLDGDIYAFDVASGEERWRFATDGAPEAHPTASEGLVFVGDNNPTQPPGHGTLHVLDASDGSEVWRLPNAQTSGPLVVDGTAYIGSEEGYLLAINAADGTERWRAATGQVSRGAAFADGTIFVGGKDGNVYALAAADGSERWRYATEGGTLATPAFADGVVYQATFNGRADQLYALDAATGAERWRFAVGARLQPPAVANGVVYLSGGDGSAYAIDAAQGTVRWRFPFAAANVDPPVVAGDTILVTGESSSLYAVDAASGKERWHLELDATIGSAPIVSGGVIVVATYAGTIYALGEPAEAAEIVLPAPGDSAAEGPVQFLWQAANGSAPISRPGGMAIAPDGTIWVPEGNQDRILIFSPDGAFREAWGTSGPGAGEFEFFFAGDGSAYGGIGFDADGNIFVLDSGNNRIQKFDGARQFVTTWGRQGDGDGEFLAPLTMTVDRDGNVYVGDDVRGDIQKFDRDGNHLMTYSSRGDGDGQNQCIPLFGVDAQGNLYLLDCARMIVQVFAPDGAFLRAWGSEGREPGQFTFPVDAAIDAAGRVYISDGGNNRVQVFDANGQYLTEWGEFGAGDGQFSGTGDLVLDGAGNIYAIDDGNGRLQKFRLLPPLTEAATPAAN